MADVSRIEYAVVSEDGEAFEWRDDKADAISFAASQPDPCCVLECVEYYTDKRIVWASHASMIDEGA